MLTRQAIVTALTGIDGVYPSEFAPAVKAPGQAWPSIGGFSFPRPRIVEQAWAVYLVLASDDRAAAAQWDALGLVVLNALWPIGIIDTPVEIQPLTIDTGQAYCAIYRVRG